MNIRKYQLHPDHCRFIRNKRKELRIPAESLSEQIGKAKSWLSQVERGIFSTIRHEDLVRLLRVLYGSSPSDQDDELLLSQFFNDVTNASPAKPKENFDYFGLFDLMDYESINLKSEFDTALEQLTKTIKNSFRCSDIRRQFAILQAVKIQNKNLHTSVLLTNLLSSVPLFTLSNDNNEINDAEVITRINALNSDLLSDIDSRIAFFNLYNVSWLNNIVSSTINAVKEAIYILLELLSPDADTTALTEKYNSLIEEINLNCKMQCLSNTKIYPIGNTKIQHLDLAGKYLSNLQKLLQELTEVQMNIKKSTHHNLNDDTQLQT